MTTVTTPQMSRRSALGGILGTLAAVAVPAVASVATAQTADAATLSQGARALSVARSFCGRTPYRYGGTTPAGFDCSGLTMYAYRRAGMYLPRTAQGQRAATRRISRASARPGDLVFFHSGRAVYHVGIYAGNGRMVDAGSSRSGIRYRAIWSSAISFGTLR